MWKSKISDVRKNVQVLTDYLRLRAASSRREKGEVHNDEDVESWRSEGKRLYEAGAALVESHSTPTIDPMRSGINERSSGNELEGSNSATFSCFQGVNARFWLSQEIGFCAYYMQNATGEGYNLYLWSSAFSERDALRVNWVPFAEEQVKYYAPVFTSSYDGSIHRIVFVFIEPDARIKGAFMGGSVLALREYALELSANGSDVTVSERNFRLRGRSGIKYNEPLGITRDEAGDIIVVGKSKGDRRVPDINQGYFAWKFSGETMNLIMPKSIKGDNGGYLFCRWGGSQPTRPEHLVVWGAEAGALSLTYVGSYLVFTENGYKNIYKANSGKIRALESIYNESAVLSGTDRCLVNTRLCNIDSTSVVLAENSIVEQVNGATVGHMSCMFYVARVNENRRLLGVVIFDRGMYCVIKDLAVLDFSTLSMNVIRESSSKVSVTIAGSGKPNIYTYNIDLGDFGRLGMQVKHTLKVETRNRVGIDMDELMKPAGKNVGFEGNSMRSSRSRKTTSVLCGQVRGVPVSSRRQIVIETIDRGIANGISAINASQGQGDKARFDEEVVTDSGAIGRTEHAMVIRSTGHEVVGAQDEGLYTYGYGGEDIEDVRSSTASPGFVRGQNHLFAGVGSGNTANASGALSRYRGIGSGNDAQESYGAALTGTAGAIANGVLSMKQNKDHVGSRASSIRTHYLEELRLCESGDCVYGNHSSRDFNTFNVSVSSFHNRSRINSSGVTEADQVLKLPSIAPNISTAPHATEPYEKESRGFFEEVPPVLAGAGLAFFLVAVVLVSCTFLYIKWKTGRFTLTRDYYDSIHGDVANEENVEAHELSPRTSHARPSGLLEIERLETHTGRLSSNAI